MVISQLHGLYLCPWLGAKNSICTLHCARECALNYLLCFLSIFKLACVLPKREYYYFDTVLFWIIHRTSYLPGLSRTQFRESTNMYVVSHFRNLRLEINKML